MSALIVDDHAREAENGAIAAMRFAMSDATISAISMDASGRLVLPKALRERLNLKGSARFAAEIVAGRIELTLADDDCEVVVTEDGFKAIRFRGETQVDAAAAVREDREEQAQRGLRR